MRLRNNPKAYDIMKENKSFVILEPENCKNKWKDIFGNNHPIYIEIGMGKGDFIYENARQFPEINFVGIEKYPSVLAAAINKINAREEKVNNLRLMHYDAIELHQVFEKDEVDNYLECKNLLDIYGSLYWSKTLDANIEKREIYGQLDNYKFTFDII